jgi:hypothetical protein
MTVRQLHVLGPNLLGSGTPETFHVHAQGCPDVHRRRLRRPGARLGPHPHLPGPLPG